MKTEYEKMIAGEFYSPMDPELRKLAQEARAKQFAFNQEADGEKRSQLIKSWFGSTGENLSLHPFLACDYGVNIHLGENFYANHAGCLPDQDRKECHDWPQLPISHPSPSARSA